jgi:hypothetical protein
MLQKDVADTSIIGYAHLLSQVDRTGPNNATLQSERGA